MKNMIEVFNWRSGLDNTDNINSLGEDLMLIDRKNVSELTFRHPFTIDVIIAIICTKGYMRGKINMKPNLSEAPGLSIILPDELLEYEYISPDFEGKFIIMSKRFIEGLNIENRFSLFMSVSENPNISLAGEEIEALLNYFSMMRRTINLENHPYRLEIARNLTLAFFYGIGYYLHNIPKGGSRSRVEKMVDDFFSLVKKHHRQHRNLEFYADKLCLTSKYMSTVIKQTSGKTAGDWIDDYVILEAKALLKSTNLTIQQISDELNFPSQSFFGKYFKRHVGASPKTYRNT